MVGLVSGGAEGATPKFCRDACRAVVATGLSNGYCQLQIQRRLTSLMQRFNYRLDAAHPEQ